jgi:flavin reductase (DIM6/NTAB) family NADH-FMN oxidoreductase RutF
MTDFTQRDLFFFCVGGSAAAGSMLLLRKYRTSVVQRSIAPLRFAYQSGKWKTGENQPSPYKSLYKEYDPADLKKTGGLYNLLISSVIPRPIALVSSMSKDGNLNCAPFSYFNALNHDPPLITLGLCTQGRKRQKKDTLRNIEETGEFVVNIISSWYVDSANHTSGLFPQEINEMELAGMTNLKSSKVSPPRVGESAIQLECKVRVTQCVVLV